MTKTRSTTPAECRAFTDLLPLLEKPETDAQARDEALAHLATCASCRAQHRVYQQMEQDAHHTLSPAAPTQWYHLEELLASIVQEMPAPEASESSPVRRLVTRPRPIRPRRLIAELAPLAIVFVMVLVAATLFASYHRPEGTTNTPSAPTGSYSALNALAMVSADEGWAVGVSGLCDAPYISNTEIECQATDPLLLHYQHGTWTPVQVSFQGQLHTISMLSATDGWAGGDHLFVHYDGHTWKPMPNPSHLSLYHLQMLSDTDGWAVGVTDGKIESLLHYDGQTWTPQPLPASLVGAAQQRLITFLDLTMISPTEGWTVGFLDVGDLLDTPTKGETAFILHYANGQWTLQSSTENAQLNSISMLSATDGWATGDAGTSNPTHPLLLHYTQGKWIEATDLNNVEATGGAVSMVSVNDGWAFGGYQGMLGIPGDQYMLHYNGQQWTRVVAFTLKNQLVSISNLHMLSATDGWGVGLLVTDSGQRDSDGTRLDSITALIVRYHNGAWSLLPKP